MQEGEACLRLSGLPERYLEYIDERHVEEGGDTDERLRGDGRREMAHHVGGHMEGLDAGPSCAHRERFRVGVGEQHLEPAGLQGLLHHLSTFEQEAPIVLAEGALAEPRRARDPGIAGRREHGSPRGDADSGRCGGRLRLLDERRERRGIVDREVGEDLAVEFDAGDLQSVHEP